MPFIAIAARKFCLVAFATSVFAFAMMSASLADQPLPDPQTTGGMGVFDALKKRSSAKGGDFSVLPIGEDVLSTVLWSATGLNRGSSGWVVPTFDGDAPYVTVYVATPERASRFDWEHNALIEVSADDVRARLGLQGFVARAHTVLVFVADSNALSRFSDPAVSRDYALIAVGAMTQNVYLASAALKLNTRYISALDPDDVRDALGLSDSDEPIALMLLGK